MDRPKPTPPYTETIEREAAPQFPATVMQCDGENWAPTETVDGEQIITLPVASAIEPRRFFRFRSTTERPLTVIVPPPEPDDKTMWVHEDGAYRVVPIGK